MDKLFLRQLTVPANIGVYEHERKTPQLLVLDLEIEIDVDKVSASDLIHNTVDYAAIYHFLCEYIAASKCQLIETLASKMAMQLMKKFELNWLRLTITKKPVDLPHIAGAGVSVERHKS